jgi:pimeloyl-ACP methyl ester carboxylesterase
MEGFADNAAAFAGALGLSHVDVLGFSIGGHAAQALALRHPPLLRRLVIVGSKPRAGVDEGTHPDVLEVGSRHEVPALEDFLWYARRHGREPSGEAIRWLAGDWITGTLPGYENAVSPHRVCALLAYMDDDWLPEEPATIAAYEQLPEWVRWNGEQTGVPGPLIERSVAVAERRQSDINDCPSFRFLPRPGDAL